MPGIVDLPQVVQAATREFADLFACEPQRRHFGEYLTGLMIAERKSVSGINREFAETTDQSQHCSALGLLGRPFYLSGRHAFCAGRGMSYMCAHGHSKLTEDAGRVGVDAGEHR